MENKLRVVRGTRDLLPGECYKFNYIRRIAQEIGDRYGFTPVETPIFEFSDVFSRTLGDSSDIIMKEMYSFPDRGGDSLTLRPEFTAAIVRLLINENLTLPAKLFTSGPVFRYERPQKCRQRQFHQINYEYFGARDYMVDFEVIALAYTIIAKVGLRHKVRLEINSLGSNEDMVVYKGVLVEYFEKYQNGLSEDSKRRLSTNPLRILDSKDRGDLEILGDAPTIWDFYSEHSRKFFDGIVDSLSRAGIPYVMNPRLVRGLDYYSDTVFEFKTLGLGAQDAIIAGGRYDGLVALMGGDDTPAVGFAGGIERI
ncbi:unnamed protein product, partial [Ixodes pacificus]